MVQGCQGVRYQSGVRRTANRHPRTSQEVSASAAARFAQYYQVYLTVYRTTASPSAATVTGKCIVRESCFSYAWFACMIFQLVHRYRFSFTITRTASSLWLRILTSISSVMVLRLDSTLKST